jgi:glycosyltransferase involved in cell wall biosynthesis
MANVPSGSANSIQIVKMCEAFKSNGHNIKLILPNLISQDNLESNYYDIKNKFYIKRIGKKIKTIKGVFNFIIPLLLVIESLKDKSNDLIITRNIIISMILIILKKKHVLELHDDISTSGKLTSLIFKLFNLLNSKYILKIIFITNSLKIYISKKFNYSNNNYKVLPDATEINNFNIKKNYKKYFNIGYFGSIYNSRGVDVILKLSKTDKNNKYFIYGGNKNESAKIKRRIGSANLLINPRVSYKNVKNLLCEMDILLMPYKDKVTAGGDIGDISKFTSPLKMFDYLGASKIILVSELEVLKEILKNKYNCIFIKNFNNINSWRNEINKINTDNIKSIILRNNALKTALIYNWKNRARDMICWNFITILISFLINLKLSQYND